MPQSSLHAIFQHHIGMKGRSLGNQPWVFHATHSGPSSASGPAPQAAASTAQRWQPLTFPSTIYAEFCLAFQHFLGGSVAAVYVAVSKWVTSQRTVANSLLGLGTGFVPALRSRCCCLHLDRPVAKKTIANFSIVIFL